MAQVTSDTKCTDILIFSCHSMRILHAAIAEQETETRHCSGIRTRQAAEPGGRRQQQINCACPSMCADCAPRRLPALSYRTL